MWSPPPLAPEAVAKQSLSLTEMNQRIFERKPIPHVFFQPRFEPWFDWHRQFNTLPEYLRGISMRDAYDLIGASLRYVDYYTGQPSPVYRNFPTVKSTVQTEGNKARRRYETPHGPLFETMEMTIDKVWRKVEFPGKGPEDLKALRWLLERQICRFNTGNFAKGAAYICERGYPQFFVPKSPYFSLSQEWMSYEGFIYALFDCKSEIEDIFKIIDGMYDDFYNQLCAHDDVKILNFGENVADAYISLKYWDDYCVPWYEKRSGQLRRAGKFTHIHIDGDFEPLLPYLKHMPFDGYEALTPEPQGDVTLEQMRDHLGGK